MSGNFWPNEEPSPWTPMRSCISLWISERSLPKRSVSEFGRDVLAPDGSVDRKKLGAIVFSDPDARRELNRLVHPKVIAEEKRLLAEAERKGVQIGIVDAALMIETGTYRDYDRLVVVYCPREVQLERLVARDGLSPEDAARRVDAQLSVEEKKLYAHYVVDSPGSLEDTERRVGEVWDSLLRDAAATH